MAVVAGLAACGGDDGEATATEGGGEPIEGVETERIGDYVHAVEDFDYDRAAPSGGDHLPPPYWLTCGVYEGEVPEELAVHSLEHGAVWIALGPASTDADRAEAESLADGRKVLVSDVPALEDPVQLVAWGARLRLESATDARAAAFVAQFVDAPTSPEAGASCESVGEPPTPPTLPTS